MRLAKPRQTAPVKVVETWLYRPGIRLSGVAVSYAKRLQSGRLDAYLLYMLIALVAVVAVVTAMAWLAGQASLRVPPRAATKHGSVRAVTWGAIVLFYV